MKPLIISIIVCVIIAIIIVFFITQKTPVTPKTPDFYKIIKLFGLEIEGNPSEHFSTDIVFKTEDDIRNNFMVFLGYLYPKMNIDNINTLLTQYGSDKNMKDILNEKKKYINLTEQGTNSFMSLYRNSLIEYYMSYMIDETDNATIITNILLICILDIAVLNSLNNAFDYVKSQLPNDYKQLEYIKYVLLNDDINNNILTMYTRTNYNKDIKLEEADEIHASRDLSCYTTKLCKQTGNIQEFINRLKPYSSLNMTIYKKLFNLSMARFLLKLNESNTTQINTDIISLLIILPPKNSQRLDIVSYETILNNIRIDRTELLDKWNNTNRTDIQIELDAYDATIIAYINKIESSKDGLTIFIKNMKEKYDILADKINKVNNV